MKSKIEKLVTLFGSLNNSSYICNVIEIKEKYK